MSEYVQDSLFDSIAGQRAAQDGQAQALGARANAEWRRKAEEAMQTLMAESAGFTADDVAQRIGLPPSRNAMGALFGSYRREGLIVCVGHTIGRRRARHAGSQRIWMATRWMP